MQQQEKNASQTAPILQNIRPVVFITDLYISHKHKHIHCNWLHENAPGTCGTMVYRYQNIDFHHKTQSLSTHPPLFITQQHLPFLLLIVVDLSRYLGVCMASLCRHLSQLGRRGARGGRSQDGLSNCDMQKLSLATGVCCLAGLRGWLAADLAPGGGGTLMAQPIGEGQASSAID